jgi:hypothetical protein
MSEPHSNLTKILMVLCIVTFVATVAFAALWLRERIEKSVPVVKEVTKEVTKEVEVPTKLTAEQQAAIAFWDRFLNARFIETPDDALYRLDSVQVTVSLNDAVKKLVSEDRVKNKFELILREHGVKIDDRAIVMLNLSIEGLWSKSPVTFLVYTPRLQLDQTVVVARKGDFRKAGATLWERGSYGFVGTQMAEGAILKSVESLGEEFANKYLAAQEKDVVP